MDYLFYNQGQPVELDDLVKHSPKGEVIIQPEGTDLIAVNQNLSSQNSGFYLCMLQEPDVSLPRNRMHITGRPVEDYQQALVNKIGEDAYQFESLFEGKTIIEVGSGFAQFMETIKSINCRRIKYKDKNNYDWFKGLFHVSLIRLITQS